MHMWGASHLPGWAMTPLRRIPLASSAFTKPGFPKQSLIRIEAHVGIILCKVSVIVVWF